MLNDNSSSHIKDVQTVYSVRRTHGHSFFEATLQVETSAGKTRSIAVSCEEPIENWDDLETKLKEHLVDKYSKDPHINVPTDPR